MNEEFREMTEYEYDLIQKLLSIDFPGREALAKQIKSSVVRKIDNEGSLEFLVNGAPMAQVERRIPIEAEAKDADGVAIHALLHVVTGLVKELEIYKDDSSSVIKMPSIPEWRLLKL